MKHIWVVESSGGRRWLPAGAVQAVSYHTLKAASKRLEGMLRVNPGLKWRVAKYERVK